MVHYYAINKLYCYKKGAGGPKFAAAACLPSCSPYSVSLAAQDPSAESQGRRRPGEHGRAARESETASYGGNQRPWLGWPLGRAAAVWL